MEAMQQPGMAQQVRPLMGDIEPVRIALEGGGIGRVIFSGSAATPDDIDALIEVLQIQKRQVQKKSATRAKTTPEKEQS